MLVVSGKDEQPEKRYDEEDLACPHCGEMQWIRAYVEHGVAYCDPRYDILHYDSGISPERVWSDETWKCDFCDRLAPVHVRVYLNEL